MTFDEASRVIKRGDIVHLRKELEEGLGPNLCNQYSWTLLMIAAMEGDTSIGRLLIEKGADLDRRNNHRDTALSLAAICDRSLIYARTKSIYPRCASVRVSRARTLSPTCNP